jgi:hypothetical protein
MLRRLILILVFSQFILLVSFAVLVGGYALASAADDARGATVLWWTAMACLMLLTVDVLLLIGTLGIASIAKPEEPEQSGD